MTTVGNRIRTINNGIDIDKFHNAAPISRASIGSDDEKFVIVMVAGFRVQKDQDTLIRAMCLLPREQYELWLVGDGVRQGELERLIESQRLGGSVRLLGMRMDVPNILRAADVVVMSSHWEGLSLSNIEGMSVGKPFVASDVNGLREVTEGYGILFPHGDEKALADIIVRLSQDEDYYRKVAQQCYERARQFDISKMVEQYNEIYEGLKS